MAYTRTSLANDALDHVGKGTLINVDTDTTEVGKLVQRHYDRVFRKCLRKGEWNFALKRVTIDPETDAPVNQYSYLFQVPSDCVRIVRVFPIGMEYKVEGGFILCDESTITLKYVSDATVANPSTIDDCFADFFGFALAAAICHPITNSVDKKKELMDSADEAFKEGSGIFSQEDIEDKPIDDYWISSRGVSQDPNSLGDTF